MIEQTQPTSFVRPGWVMRIRGRSIGRLGLQGKLVLAFSMLLLAALATATGFALERSQSTLAGLMGEQARQLSQTLAFAAVEPYQGGDADQLHRLGSDLIKSRNIILVAFFDAEGKPLTTACRDPDFRIGRFSEQSRRPQSLMRVEERHLPTLGNFLQVTAPVFDRRSLQKGPAEAGVTLSDMPMRGVRLHGYITVGVSQDAAQAELHRVSMVALGLGLAIFVLCLPLAIALIHRIFLPIRQLVSATNRISTGQYDAHVQMRRPDEIGQLAASFNEMVDCIHQHRRQLEDANHELEDKVRRRTSELQATNCRLSAEIAEKEDFLRAVSHDLNAPLRNISGMAMLLLTKYRGRLDEEVAYRLERIRKNVEAESGLIAELLELSRIKTRRHKMELVDIDGLVRELVDCFEPDLREKNISIILDNMLPSFACERMRVRQVFQNLIDNAIKYMGDGPERRISIGWTEMADGYGFYVRDTGMGIHAEDVQKVFYVFRRGRNTAGTNVSGKGVGLASVKSIIETYGGRIWVESELGRGSTFRFSIPKAAPREPALAAA
ncbi:MAG: ATP-binding protein [Tepidisphaeraceae bacterium]|jgi:signal transduction histidine kinase